MKPTTIHVEDDTAAAHLIDWILVLIDSATDELSTQHFTGNTTVADIRARLTQMRPMPAPADIDAVATALTNPANLGSLHALLRNLAGHLELTDKDSSFPWSSLHQLTLPTELSRHALPWRLREQVRMRDGSYKPVPWAKELPAIKDHYAHISLTNPDMLAFTETEAKGERDIQTQIKPGRYLARFYPELAPHQVRDLTATIERIAELKFAVTAEEIEAVYITGPGSCMSHDAGDFDGHCHPVNVYGNSDLQLAYIENGDEPTARALVWPERKRHGRIYGDEALLAQQLERAGYVKGSLYGARIRRIVNKNDDTTLIMPYIDGCGTFDILDDEWLTIGGDHCATATCGIAYLENTATCERCDERVPEGRLADVDGESWCCNCREAYSFVCAYSGDYHRDGDDVSVVVRATNGTNVSVTWSVYARDDHATYCDATEAWYADSHFDFVHLDSGETWVDWYFEEHGETIDGKPVPKTRHEAAAEQVAA